MEVDDEINLLDFTELSTGGSQSRKVWVLFV